MISADAHAINFCGVMMQLFSTASDATISNMMRLFSVWSDFLPNNETIILDPIHLWALTAAHIRQ